MGFDLEILCSDQQLFGVDIVSKSGLQPTKGVFAYEVEFFLEVECPRLF